MNDFRFGVSVFGTGGGFAGKCREIEHMGFDAITVPDHLGPGRPAPLLAATAAAMATTDRIRVGTLVLNVPFYNLTLLARDIADVVRISGGRFDLGLGAGNVRSEFEDAGIRWRPAEERIEQLAHAIPELWRRLDAEEVDRPPLLIAGNSDGVLRLAAEHADIIGYSGLRHATGEPPGTLALTSADELIERTAFVAAAGAGRAPERNMLIQHVEQTTDRAAAAERWAARFPESRRPDPATLLDAPQLLLGTVDEMAAQLVERQNRFGYSYFTIFEPYLKTFAPVLKAQPHNPT